MSNNPNAGMLPVYKEFNRQANKWEIKEMGTGAVLSSYDTPWDAHIAGEAEIGRRGEGTKGLPGNSFDGLEPGVDPMIGTRMGTDLVLESQSGKDTGLNGKNQGRTGDIPQRINLFDKSGKPSAGSR